MTVEGLQSEPSKKPSEEWKKRLEWIQKMYKSLEGKEEVSGELEKMAKEFLHSGGEDFNNKKNEYLQKMKNLYKTHKDKLPGVSEEHLTNMVPQNISDIAFVYTGLASSDSLESGTRSAANPRAEVRDERDRPEPQVREISNEADIKQIEEAIAENRRKWRKSHDIMNVIRKKTRGYAKNKTYIINSLFCQELLEEYYSLDKKYKELKEDYEKWKGYKYEKPKPKQKTFAEIAAVGNKTPEEFRDLINQNKARREAKKAADKVAYDAAGSVLKRHHAEGTLASSYRRVREASLKRYVPGWRESVSSRLEAQQAYTDALQAAATGRSKSRGMPSSADEAVARSRIADGRSEILNPDGTVRAQRMKPASSSIASSTSTNATSESPSVDSRSAPVQQVSYTKSPEQLEGERNRKEWQKQGIEKEKQMNKRINSLLKAAKQLPGESDVAVDLRMALSGMQSKYRRNVDTGAGYSMEIWLEGIKAYNAIKALLEDTKVSSAYGETEIGHKKIYYLNEAEGGDVLDALENVIEKEQGLDESVADGTEVDPLTAAKDRLNDKIGQTSSWLTNLRKSAMDAIDSRLSALNKPKTQAQPVSSNEGTDESKAPEYEEDKSTSSKAPEKVEPEGLEALKKGYPALGSMIDRLNELKKNPRITPEISKALEDKLDNIAVNALTKQPDDVLLREYELHIRQLEKLVRAKESKDGSDWITLGEYGEIDYAYGEYGDPYIYTYLNEELHKYVPPTYEMVETDACNRCACYWPKNIKRGGYFTLDAKTGEWNRVDQIPEGYEQGYRDYIASKPVSKEEKEQMLVNTKLEEQLRGKKLNEEWEKYLGNNSDVVARIKTAQEGLKEVDITINEDDLKSVETIRPKESSERKPVVDVPKKKATIQSKSIGATEIDSFADTKQNSDKSALETKKAALEKAIDAKIDKAKVDSTTSTGEEGSGLDHSKAALDEAIGTKAETTKPDPTKETKKTDSTIETTLETKPKTTESQDGESVTEGMPKDFYGEPPESIRINDDNTTNEVTLASGKDEVAEDGVFDQSNKTSGLLSGISNWFTNLLHKKPEVTQVSDTPVDESSRMLEEYAQMQEIRRQKAEFDRERSLSPESEYVIPVSSVSLGSEVQQDREQEVADAQSIDNIEFMSTILDRRDQVESIDASSVHKADLEKVFDKLTGMNLTSEEMTDDVKEATEKEFYDSKITFYPNLGGDEGYKSLQNLIGQELTEPLVPVNSRTSKIELRANPRTILRKLDEIIDEESPKNTSE